jgi:uncharacterized membrane protein YhiD involved in acid resistance
MTFQDLFKSSFLENVASFSALDVAIAFGLALVIGLFIFLIYKKTYCGVMYSSSFGISLIAMTLITTLIILTISSNVILSLGMVGALSIVRFRTAVKDPLDIAYLFWSISAGIVTGAGMIPLAVFGSVFIGIVLVVFATRKIKDNPYLLVVDCRDEAIEYRVLEIVKSGSKKNMVKSKTVSAKGIELTLEIRLCEMETAFVNRIAEIDGVASAVLVSYNGEYLS